MDTITFILHTFLTSFFDTGATTMMTMTMVMLRKLRSTRLAFPAPFSNSPRDMISTIMSG